MVAFRKLADGDWEMIAPAHEQAESVVEEYNNKQADMILHKAKELRIEGYNSVQALSAAIKEYEFQNGCRLTEDEIAVLSKKYWGS